MLRIILGDKITDYFSHHDIKLEKLVYRAMEIDKSYENVGKILGDFKQLEFLEMNQF